jgi:AraC-like DNA-binding protein
MAAFLPPGLGGYVIVSREYAPRPRRVDFHLHDWFEIYFFIRGDMNYLVEKCVYPMKYGDVVVVNGDEVHMASFLSDAPYERIVVHFDPAVARLFESPGVSLLGCFTGRPKGEGNKLALDAAEAAEVYDRLTRMEREGNAGTPEAELMKVVHLVGLLVYLNAIYDRGGVAPAQAALPEILPPVLDYIDANLEGELTLEALSTVFYIDKYYLCRLFKRSIGSTLHQYVIFKRISEAKRLLACGMSVTEASMKCGFTNYNNFLKRFKQTTGVSPGRFRAKAESATGETALRARSRQE